MHAPLPPDAAIHTRSPRRNNALSTIVWCISASNTAKKHSLHSRWPFLGRFTTGLRVPHASHSGGGGGILLTAQRKTTTTTARWSASCALFRERTP
jgi:hypothetical protein